MLRRPGAVVLAVAAAVLLVDQASKFVVRLTMEPVGTSISLVGDLLKLTYVRNTGAAFGMFPGNPVMFAAVSVVVLAGIVVYWLRVHPSRALLVVALGVLAGGACGNLIDRVTQGRVTDFIQVPFIPVFNIADMSILTGVCILMWWLLFGPASHEAATGAVKRGEAVVGASDAGEAPTAAVLRDAAPDGATPAGDRGPTVALGPEED